jgi:hypothetical protein
MAKENVMDWYLGRNQRGSETSRDLTSFFPADDYLELKREGRKDITSRFAADEYFDAKAQDQELGKQRSAQRKENLDYVLGKGATATKAVSGAVGKLMKASAGKAWDTGVQLSKDLIELSAIKRKYGNLDETLVKEVDEQDNLIYLPIIDLPA